MYNCNFRSTIAARQAETLQKNIADIKRILAAGKRKYGGYNDSQGLRYLPVKYDIQPGDYAGRLVYTKWFNKNFPDDSGFPDFLFGCTIILFKTDKIKDAEK